MPPSHHLARLTAQALSGPPCTSVDDVVGRLLAVQAQDPRGARLAVRARTAGLRATDVERALGDRSLVVSWLNRGTLHLVRAEDWPWLHQLTAPRLRAGSARRLAQEGVSPELAERGVAVVERALADGPRTRDELRSRLASAGVPVAGQALVHVLLAATLRGVCVRGPVVDGEQAFALVRDWLGPAPAVDRDVALGELARRYLAGHGPASAADLARWAGLALGDARRGLRRVGDRLVETADGLLDLAGRDEPAPLPPPRLLGPFEPLLLGWTSRDDVVGPSGARIVAGGVFRPFALVDGRAAATWSWARGGVDLASFGQLPERVTEQLQADALDVARFLAG